MSLDDLLRRADEQLYIAKSQGRNRTRQAGRLDDGDGPSATVIHVA
jgi:hypothetical protein